MPRWRVVFVWQLVQILHWAAVWLYLGGQTSGGAPEHNLGLGTYACAVIAHILATAYIMVVVVAEVLVPERDVVRRIGIDDPHAGPFDRAPDRAPDRASQRSAARLPAGPPDRAAARPAPIGLQDGVGAQPRQDHLPGPLPAEDHL